MAVKTGRAKATRASTEAGALTRNQIVQELTRSPHGALSQYVPVGVQAAAQEPEFFAHLIAWNEANGQIRDARVALPVLSLSESDFPEGLIENSLAHLVLLDPRLLEKAVRFSKSVGVKGRGRRVRATVEAYLRAREKNWAWWERSTLQHRDSMKALYALSHVKPNAMAQQILFKREYPKGTIFYDLAHLKELSPTAIAGTIMRRKIPFLVAQGALGPKIREEDVVLALIGAMSPTEVVTNTKMLERLGVKTRPALRAAYEEALGRVATSKKTTLKASRAAAVIGDEKLKKKLNTVQEKQLGSMKGIEGDWLVLGDRSGSMASAIEAARFVAATLAKLVRGKVHLVFFNDTPAYYPVTGLGYDEIKAKTQYVQAGGTTSVGCGLLSLMERNIEVDGIAIVTDGQENRAPFFANVYAEYARKVGKSVPVYVYQLGAESVLTQSMRAQGQDPQVFDVFGVDYYSLPNLAQTMRANRYSLADEIMSVPLLTVEKALTVGRRVA